MPKQPRPPGTNDADLKLTASEQRNNIERQILRNARIALRAADTRLRQLSIAMLALHVPKVVSEPVEEIACQVETALEQIDSLLSTGPKERGRT